jgi:hypothetical protein
LLAADAFAGDLGKALLRLAQHSVLSPPLGVDAFKLSHHGSRANLITEFLAAIQAKHYLVSTNNERFAHPNDEALARVVLYSDDMPTLWFNHATERNLRWLNPAIQQKYGLQPVSPSQPVALRHYPIRPGPKLPISVKLFKLTRRHLRLER